MPDLMQAELETRIHAGEAVRELTYAQGIREALQLAMRRDERVVVLGEDVGKFGGVFRATVGLQETFGDDRVIRRDRGAVEGLRGRPDGLRPEAQRRALVLGQLGARAGAAGEDRDDGDVLAQLTKAGDQAAARQRGIVGMRGDEDVAHRGRG